MKKNIAILAAIVCMATALAACGSTDKAGTGAQAGSAGTSESTSGSTSESTSAEAGGKLVMATNAEFPPYEYYDNNQIVGIDADVARAIASKLGMELEIKDMAFNALIPALQSGKADFVAAGMTASEDRKENVDFTDPYATAAQVIIVKDDSPIASLKDLDGKKIGVQTGTTGDMDTDEIKDAKTQRFNKGMEAVMALSQGKIDAVIIDRQPAEVFVEQNQGLKLIDGAFPEEKYAIAVKKGNKELLDKLNGALKELKDSGELQKIIDQYLNANS